MLISVIVPIYNTVDYLRKCIDSIISQTYKELEIILIDDGSDDGCDDICDQYAEKDMRIRVIHRKNGGLVSARKLGLNICKGGYVLPVDSDDCIDNNMVENMAKIIEEYDSDIVQCGVKYIYENGETVPYEEPVLQGFYDLSENDNKVFENLFWNFSKSRRGIRSNMWSCLFRKELIYKYQMMVPDDLTNGEDDACFYPTILNAESYYLIGAPLYSHFLRSGSMSSAEGKFTFQQVTQIDNAIRQYLDRFSKKTKVYLGYKRYLLCRIENIMRYNYHIGLTYNYKLPIGIIPFGSKVIVYGAGKIGQSFVAQNLNVGWFEIVAWVDKQKKGSLYGIEISNLNVLSDVMFDYVLIAVGTRLYDEVKLMLLDSGYPEEKLLWEKPCMDMSTWYYEMDI